MQLHVYLLQCLALLALLAGAADSDRYKVVTQAASQAPGKPQLREGQQYAFYEYWYHAPNIQQCALGGFDHARLIVGQLKRDTRQGTRDFTGYTYDLWKNGGILNGAFGGKTSSKKIKWIAGQYKDNAGRWKVTQADISYEYAGEVAHDVDDKMIKRLGDAYCENNPTYNIITNNCITFVQYVYADIHQ